MVYLQVPHVDGQDCDYFKFDSLKRLALYIVSENITCCTITEEAIDVPEDDYTLIKE